MDVRMLGVIQRSIPLLFRHIDGYIDLAERDWGLLKRQGIRQLQWLAILAVSASFTLLLACALIIATTWDGPYRLLVIGLMTGVFALVAIVAWVSLMRRREAAFAAFRQEWSEDRALIRQLLSKDEAVQADRSDSGYQAA
jgi:uncharacterized membrane protein YqjE